VSVLLRFSTLTRLFVLRFQRITCCDVQYARRRNELVPRGCLTLLFSKKDFYYSRSGQILDNPHTKLVPSYLRPMIGIIGLTSQPQTSFLSFAPCCVPICGVVHSSPSRYESHPLGRHGGPFPMILPPERRGRLRKYPVGPVIDILPIF
jgi:hypothetical protein